MKYLITAIIIFTFINVKTFAQNPGDNVFSGIQIYTININFSQPDFWDSLTYYYEQGNEQYMSADVTINGTTISNCGVRLKGNSSYSHPNNKKSIKISFDEYVTDQLWDGMKSVHLNNCYGDPTFMREKIFLDFCKSAGINAPRSNYANVFFNDTLFAFYSMVENIDKKFLKSRFGINSGDLFKAVDGFEGNQIISDFKWYTSVPDSYYTRYELKTEGSTTAWGQLITFIDTLNNGTNIAASLPAAFNLNSLYKSIAADILFANLDSYSNSGRNFYFYFNPSSGKIEWISWDAGLCFGGYGGGVSNFENLSLTYVVSASQRPLIGKIYTTTSLKNDYLNSLCFMYKNYFTTNSLFAKIDSIANKIRSYVYADPRKQYTNSQFEVNILSDLSISGVGGGNRIPGLKSFINSRRTNVQTQLNNLGINCNLTVNPGDVVINEFMAKNDSIPDPHGQLDDWIEFYNNTSHDINLGGMYLTDNFNNPTKWQFPSNTIIEANSYLIVWADEDIGQIGLHASFKLSADGEQIRLSNTDVSILDSVTFGPQVGNLSMARIPNGTGPFVRGNPTFNAYNGGTSDADNESSERISNYKLAQNYPNPFNPETVIEFEIPNTTKVILKVFDILGREVAELINETKNAGRYKVVFNSSSLSSGIECPSGVYFYQIVAGDFIQTKRMLLIK